MRTLSLLAVLLAASIGIQASTPRVQAVDAPWATLATAHYRIHYPSHPDGGFESFAREVAANLEGLHETLNGLVGRVRLERTDVIIRDPYAASNGMTFSGMKRPFIELWRTSPESDLEIAHDRSWAVGLAAHELAHLHHLTWPERNPSPWKRLMYDPIGVSPVAKKAPGWLVEGYATLLEGKIPGMGRPHSPFRALVLREWAREGRLPAYGSLSNADPVLGGAGRYLISSAFLGWLEQGSSDPKVLQTLWKRMASSRYKTFDAAFKATFGRAPQEAYARFGAELTHSALEMERRIRAAGLREGVAWTRVEGAARDLSVSPDGKHLLAQVLQKDRPGLWIWELQAADRDQKKKEKAAQKDPDLPTETPSLVPVKEPKTRLGSVQFFLPEHPQWDAGPSLAFKRRAADAEGVLRMVDGRWLHRLPDQPAPSIQRLWPVKEGTAWILAVEGKTIRLPFEPFGSVAWDRASRQIYASTAVQGVLEILRVPFDPAATNAFGERTILTRTAAGAAYPAPTPDGKVLYFGLLTARGVQIRKLDLQDAPVPPGPWNPEEHPFVAGAVSSPPDEQGLVLPPSQVPLPAPYRVADSHQLSGRAGFTVSPSDASYHLGVGGNDFLGRLDWMVVGSTGLPQDGARGPRGAMAGLAWNGWAWSPRLQVFSQMLRPSRQRFEPVQGMDAEQRGGEVAIERNWNLFDRSARFRAALADERVERLEGAGTGPRRLATVEAAGSAAFNRDGFTLSGGAGLLEAWGRTEGEGWRMQRANVTLRTAYRADFDLTLKAQAGRMEGTAGPLDRFQLGGQSLGLLPRSFEIQQVFQPALPMFSATGTRFSRWRTEAFGGLVYLEGVALWEAGKARPAYTRVAGLEVAGDTRDMALVGDSIRRLLGAMQIRLGVHRPLDGPMKGRTVGTVALLNRF